jgi:phosphorylcholine metabolism protein LicD
MINKTSYVENCETSAFGRALAALGIGIETSIASANEVSMAIAQQGLGDLTDKLGLVPTYDDLTAATLKSDYLKLVAKLPKEEHEKYTKDLHNMTPARFEKGIQFLQSKIAKP